MTFQKETNSSRPWTDEDTENKTFYMKKNIIHKRLHNQYSGFLQDTEHFNMK